MRQSTNRKRITSKGSGKDAKKESKPLNSPASSATSKKGGSKQSVSSVVSAIKKKYTVYPHPKYGTSKLEDKFASEFLDKLGVRYTRQFEAADIGRFFDFYLNDENLIIEVDGDYWHSNPEKYDEDDLSPMQKRNRKVDEYKEKWALLHSIPIMRIWESDINKNPKKVMEDLKSRISNIKEQEEKKNNRKKRH